MDIPPSPLSKEDMEKFVNTAKLFSNNFDVLRNQIANIPQLPTFKDELMNINKVIAGTDFSHLLANKIVAFNAMAKVNNTDLGVKELLGVPL